MVALEEKNPILHPVFVTRLKVRGSAQQLVFCAHHDYVLHILWQCCGDVSPEKRSKDQQSKSENKSLGDLLAFILPLCHSHALINYTGTVHNWLLFMYVGKHRGVVFVRVVLFWFLFPKRRIYRSTRHRMPAAVLSLLLSAITIYHCYYCYYNLHLCGKPFKATLVLSLYLVVIEKWLHDCHKSSAFMSHKGQSINLMSN